MLETTYQQHLAPRPSLCPTCRDRIRVFYPGKKLEDLSIEELLLEVEARGGRALLGNCRRGLFHYGYNAVVGFFGQVKALVKIVVLVLLIFVGAKWYHGVL